MPFKKLIKDDFWKRVWIQKQLWPDSYSQVVPARESVWWEVLSLLDLVDWDESDDDWLLLQLVTFENEGSKSTIMKIFFFWQSAQWLIFDSLKLYFVSPDWPVQTDVCQNVYTSKLLTNHILNISWQNCVKSKKKSSPHFSIFFGNSSTPFSKIYTSTITLG